MFGIYLVKQHAVRFRMPQSTFLSFEGALLGVCKSVARPTPVYGAGSRRFDEGLLRRFDCRHCGSHGLLTAFLVKDLHEADHDFSHQRCHGE